MRLTNLLPIGLVLTGCLVVAIVRGQDSDPLAERPTTDAPQGVVPMAERVYGEPTPAAPDADRAASSSGDAVDLSPEGAQADAPATTRKPVRRTSSLADRLQRIRAKTLPPAQTPAASEEPTTVEPVQPAQLPTAEPVEAAPMAEPTEEPMAHQAEPRERIIVAQRPSESTEPASAASTRDPADELVMTNRGPVLSVQTLGPKTILIGKRATYTVVVVNNGQTTATDVVVNVDVPLAAEVTGNSATTGVARANVDEQRGTVVQWKISELRPQGREQMNLDVTPQQSRPIDLTVDWSFAPVRSTAQVQVLEPKLEMSLAGPQEVLFGETKVYTITINNPGTGDAENVNIHLLPLTPDQGAGGSQSIGTLPAGSRKVIEVELTARQAGALAVRCEVSGDGGLSDESALDVLVRRAVLEVDVEGPQMKYAGTAGRYRVRLLNSGDAIARDVVAAVKLPRGAQVVGSTEGGQLDDEKGVIQWAAGAMRPGAVRVFELQCVLSKPGQNQMEIVAQGADQLRVAGRLATTVEALADLKLVVNDPQGPIELGKDTVYEVQIMNRGTKTAENIGVVGFFSEGIEPVSVQGTRGEIGPGEVVLDPLPRLAPGEQVRFQIVARASTEGNHVFRAEVTCSEPDTKLASEESTRFYAVNQPSADEPAATTAQAPESPAEPATIQR